MVKNGPADFRSPCGQLTVADPDLELREGSGFDLLTLLAFLPSVISSSFFTQNKGGLDQPLAYLRD